MTMFRAAVVVACVATVTAGCGDGGGSPGATSAEQGGTGGEGAQGAGSASSTGAGAEGPGGALEQCLSNGGAITQVEAIDNNVAVMHGGITGIATSAAGQIAVASTDGALKWWTVRGEAEGTSTTVYGSAQDEGSAIVRAVSYGADDWLVAGDEEGLVQRWDTTNFVATSQLSLGSDAITAVTVSAAGDRVAVADTSYQGNITLWPQDGTAPQSALTTVLWKVNALAFLPDTGALVTAGDQYNSATVEIRDPAEPGTVVGDWDGAPGAVQAMAVITDGSRLIAVGDGFVVVLDTAAPAEPLAIATDTGHQAIAVVLGTGDAYFATVGAEGTLRYWSTDTVAPLASVALLDARGVGREATTDAIVTATADGTIQIQRCVAP